MAKYLILDSRGSPIAHCVADIRPEQEVWTLTVDDGDMKRLLEHEYVQLVGTADSAAAMEGRLLRGRGTRVEVQVLRPLEKKVRQNLRMPVRFASFLYPVSGAWRGRRVIVSHDLSCGGIAFFCEEPLAAGEVVQIVIPVTAEPLLLNARVLRQRPSPEATPLYAAEFEELTRDEESMVREAVFSLQISSTEEAETGKI